MPHMSEHFDPELFGNLKLIAHMVAGPSSSDDTIGIDVVSGGTMHGVFAHQPHDHPHWRNEKVIYNSEDNPRVD